MGKGLNSIILIVLMLIGALTFVVGAVADSYNPMLFVTYIYGAVCVVLAIVSSAKAMMAKPEGIKSSLMGIGALVAVLVLAYIMAGSEVKEGQNISETASKLSGAGLYALYILFIATIAAVVYSGVVAVKK